METSGSLTMVSIAFICSRFVNVDRFPHCRPFPSTTVSDGYVREPIIGCNEWNFGTVIYNGNYFDVDPQQFRNGHIPEYAPF